MGILVIDGTSIYEVDEDCLKNHTMPKDCTLPESVWNLKEEENSSKEQTC